MKQYRIKNWSNYNTSLIQRGSINFWFSEETIRACRQLNDLLIFLNTTVNFSNSCYEISGTIVEYTEMHSKKRNFG